MKSSGTGKATGPANNFLLFKRRYRATLEDLWSLWTTKDGFESWWGPSGFQVHVHTIEPREGGELHYEMYTQSVSHIKEMTRLGRGAVTVTRGRFVDVQPHEHLTINHLMDFFPGVEPYEHWISVDFASHGEFSEMDVRVGRAHDDYTTNQAAQAFESQLEKIDRKLELSQRAAH